MQLGASKTATKKKQSGLNRLKTGVKSAAAAENEESKGGESSGNAAAL